MLASASCLAAMCAPSSSGQPELAAGRLRHSSCALSWLFTPRTSSSAASWH